MNALTMPLDTILDVSNADPTPVHNRLIKLNEEVGELNAAYLSSIGSANASASADDNVTEEAVDVIICAIDVLNVAGDINQLWEMLEHKSAKWRNKLKDN